MMLLLKLRTSNHGGSLDSMMLLLKLRNLYGLILPGRKNKY